MATDTKDYISHLNKLIETLKDGELGHMEGAKDASSEDVKNFLMDVSAQRAKFAATLQDEVRRLGGDPDKSGSALGLAHRGWYKVKTSVTGNKDHAVLAESERGDDHALNVFKEVLEKGLPTDLDTQVRRIYDEVRQAHNKIRELRDRTAVKA